MDGAFGSALAVAFVPAFAGGGDECAGFAGSGGGAAGGGIEGNFGGPGTIGRAFVLGRGGGTALAGRSAPGGADGLEKPAKGRGATVGGRADGFPFAPTGAGTLLPSALSAVGAFGGVGGSLGGMKSVSPRRIKRQSYCSSSLRVSEGF